MNAFYLKRGREELDMSVELFGRLSDSNFKRMITHLLNAMDFIVDFANGKHTNIVDDIEGQKELVEKLFGKEFLEDYFFIYNMKSKDAKILGDNIIISGKSSMKMRKSDVGQLIKRVIGYFSMLYSKAVDDLDAFE